MLRMHLTLAILLVPSLCLCQRTASLPASEGGATSPTTSRLSEPSYQAEFPPVVANGLVEPKFDKQHLVSFGSGDNGQPVRLYDKRGTLLFDTALELQDAAKVYVHDAAVTKSSTAVVASAAITGDGTLADLILEVGKSGIRRAIRTSPFRPLKLCASEEGTVWAYGWERDVNGGDRHGHHGMLREYSFERGEIRSVLDRASVQTATGVPVGGTHQELQMRCGPEKVVLFNGPIHEFMEYDIRTNRLLRLPLPSLPEHTPLTSITGSALTDSGDLYVSTQLVGKPSRTGIFRLSVNSSQGTLWETIAFLPSGGKWFRLLGNDGERLVYSRGLQSPTVFWSVVQTEVTK